MENRIRELRKAAGLRQEDLARELSVSYRSLRQFARDEQTPAL